MTERATEIEIVVPKSEPFPTFERTDDDDVAHIVQLARGHTHALCGVELDMDSLNGTGDAPDCPVCVSIARNWLNGAGWDGFGQPPGRKRRREIEEML